MRDSTADKKDTVLQASISPTIVSPGSSAARAEAKQAYSLAIFPFKIYAVQWGDGYLKQLETEGLKAIDAAAAGNKRVDLAYSYSIKNGMIKADLLAEDTIANGLSDIWKKKSMFSDFEPDWASVRQVGANLGVSLVALLRSAVGKGTQVYLYDLKNRKVYSKEFSVTVYAFEQNVKNAYRDLMKKFLADKYN